MKMPKGKVKMRAKCFKCNRTWVLVKSKLSDIKDYVLPEKIVCIFCGHENKQSELRIQKVQR